MDAAAQLQIPYQEQSDQCCPNLNLERIGRGADKSLDSKVLLERADSERCRSAFRTDVDHDSEVMPITVPN